MNDLESAYAVTLEAITNNFSVFISFGSFSMFGFQLTHSSCVFTFIHSLNDFISSSFATHNSAD